MRRVLLIAALALLPAEAIAQSGSYLWDVQLAQDPTFLKRVQRAIVQTAVNVRAESTGTPSHAQRSSWAGSVLSNPVSYAGIMAVAFVTQAPVAGTASCTTTNNVITCTITATDAQLQTISDSLWNDYAVQ